MTKRKTEFRAGYLLGTLVVIAVLVGVNLLGRARFERLDLTKDRVFTVSPVMRTILHGLPDVVKATYYVSSELPDELVNVRRDTLDRFQELERLSGGNFQYRVVDVPKAIFDEDKRSQDPALDRLFGEISAAGIKPAALSVRRRGSAEQVLIFSAITVTYLDKPAEFIDPYVEPERLEYDLAVILVRLTQAHKPIVALFDGKPKPIDLPSPSPYMPPRRGTEFSALVDALGELFDVRQVELTEQSPIPEGTRCLIVAQPNGLNERQKYEINRFISAGGNAVFLVSRYAIDFSSGRGPFLVEQNDPGLRGMFNAWGLAIGDKIIADAELGQVVLTQVPTRRGVSLEPQLMPTLIVLTGEELDQQSPVTSKIVGLYVKNATPIHLDDQTLARNKIAAEVLAHTSVHSWLLSVGAMPYVSEFQFRPPRKENEFDGPQTVAVMLHGTFPFTYEGKPVPPWPASAEPSDGTATQPENGAVPADDSGGESPGIAPDDGTEPGPAVEGGETEPAGSEADPAAISDETAPDEEPAAEGAGTVEEEAGKTTQETPPTPVEPAVAAVESRPATVLVVSTAELMKLGSPDMAQSRALIDNHLAFINGALGTLAQGYDLASIRAKTTGYRPFENATGTRLTVYAILNMIPVPLVVIVLGVIRYAARRRSRRVYRNRQLGRARRVEP